MKRARADSTGYLQHSTAVLNYGGSEINLHAYDSLGNHLGLDYSTGFINEEIPGAHYSGPLPSIEWMILPPDLYTLEVVCISAETEEEFTVVSTDYRPSPGILDVSPRVIEVQAEPGTTLETPFLISEVGHQHGLSNVTVVLSNLIDTERLEIEPLTIPLNFDLLASETRLVMLQYSVPTGTPLNVFQGTITVTATDIESGEALEEVIPITLEIVLYTDNVRVREDLNQDGKVTIEDLAIWGAAFGSSPGDSRWNHEADINGDGRINVIDGVLIAMARTE